jgi:UDP-N-acetylenolpyruvoylglucosamine reductase
MKTFFDYPLTQHNTFGIESIASTYIVIETEKDIEKALEEY